MEIIDLQNIQTLPDEFIENLSAYDDFFGAHEFLEAIVSMPKIAGLIQDIDDYCKRNLIVGYHYTRALPKSILTKGMLVRSGAEIRKDFLIEHGTSFTQDELDAIKTAWDRHFNAEQERVRGNRIWFNFTLKELGGLGSRALLDNYGGEQVYFCIDELDRIGRKIKSIGEPLVIKCVLEPSSVVTFDQTPWGNIAVSAYHRTVNPEAYTVDRDGYLRIPVPPENIEVFRVLTNNALQRINR
jgi:hypothetical protein